MRFTALLAIVMLITPAHAGLIGAYYYPWHGDFPGGHGFDDTLRHHLVPPQAPAIGTYSNRDAATIAAHIDQSHRGKIDFWAVSWWGPSSAEDVTFREHILKSPRASELKYAIHYESPGRLGKMSDPNFAALIPDFRHFGTNYFSNPNYLKINNRPVVFIYLTRAYFNTPVSRAAVAELRATMRKEFNCDPYLIGDDLFGGGLSGGPVRVRVGLHQSLRDEPAGGDLLVRIARAERGAVASTAVR